MKRFDQYDEDELRELMLADVRGRVSRVEPTGRPGHTTDILKLMKDGRQRTAGDVAQALNIHRTTAHTQLARLTEKDKLKREFLKDGKLKIGIYQTA